MVLWRQQQERSGSAWGHLVRGLILKGSLSFPILSASAIHLFLQLWWSNALASDPTTATIMWIFVGCCMAPMIGAPLVDGALHLVSRFWLISLIVAYFLVLLWGTPALLIALLLVLVIPIPPNLDHPLPAPLKHFADTEDATLRDFLGSVPDESLRLGGVLLQVLTAAIHPLVERFVSLIWSLLRSPALVPVASWSLEYPCLPSSWWGMAPPSLRAPPRPVAIIA